MTRSEAEQGDLNLPKAIKRDSIKNSLIFPNSTSARNLNGGMKFATAFDDERQIFPHMPALPKKNRHNGNKVTPASGKNAHSSRQIRLHQLKKRQHHRPRQGISATSPAQLLSEPLKRLPPARIPCTVPKQNKPMHSHTRGP
ncbi:hypothetical protein GGD41_005875 [Paraburkholderia bryophila]|uniref:Uncharacterized protein n=1 Tax=Paraburkholderia bryophila TaxID=420952 RepID=A0A7Y9WDD7_9BURK|nr:hypothetical protein [Paraburkholderia bryophila]